MGLLDTIRYKYELHRLEKRYTRREGRTTFVSGAQYIDGEYVYPDTLPSPSPSSSTSTGSSSSNPSSPSMTSSSHQSTSSPTYAFPSTMSRSVSAAWSTSASATAGNENGNEAGRGIEDGGDVTPTGREGHISGGEGSSPWDHAGSAMNGVGSSGGEKKAAFWKRK